MFDAKSLLDQFLGSAQGQLDPRKGGAGGSGDLMQKGKDFLSSNAGGLAAGGLAGILLGSKTGRKIGGKALTYGGLALVAGLAYKAYKDYQAGQQPGSQASGANAGPNAGPNAGQTGASSDMGTSGPWSRAPLELEAPRGTAFDPERAPGGSQQVAVTLLTAMIAAAKADGHIDADEQRRIFGKMDEAGLDNEAKAFLMDELRAPLDLDKIVASATTPETAAEIYAASRLAIDPDHRAEHAYLQMLAARLDLDPALVAEIENAVKEAELA
ncbi:tellurite resistance TerB family protein [Pannonibacter sp.]|uniref:tellurite resistance TerB family protein n=1 Tax=Pannonibacter sp. TaxID=1906786 RepID=UPI003F708109